MSEVRIENTEPNQKTELTIAELSAVGGGKMEAQLNSRSVNPIVVARDRTLNS